MPRLAASHSWTKIRHLFVLFALTPAAAVCQNSQPKPAPPPCTDEALDFSFHAYAATDHTQVLAFNYRNTGDNPCILPQYRHQNGYPTYQKLPDSRIQSALPRTVLAPNAIVHTSLRWQTVPTPPDHRCEDQQFRFLIVGTPQGNLVLTSRTLLPPLCSTLQDDDDYHPGPFVPEWKPSSDLAQPIPSPPAVTTPKLTYFENERVHLHVALTDRPADDPTCPVLLETVRDDRGELRIDEVLNPTPSHIPDGPGWEVWKTPNFGCHNRHPVLGPNNEFDFSVPLGMGAVWVGKGKHTFGFIQLAGFSEEGEFRQVATEPITIDVRSAAEIPRTWGKTEKGVRIDLTLDKQTYPLGEDIPLHIATEDVSSPTPVYNRSLGHHAGFSSSTFLPDMLEVTVEDENGVPVTAKQFGWSDSFRPLPCPTAYPKNTPVPQESTLSDHGLLPKKPGVYKVTVSWQPYTSRYATCDEVPPDPAQPDPTFVPDRPFVKVTSNSVTIRIGNGPSG